ncbi:MAG: N-acetylmuramoyl-L-alanine amidase [Leptospiraceae bacterium]|nr:N-acetylmuramoyl-L-alanine amidase [Leptospiraceae bacterium]
MNKFFLNSLIIIASTFSFFHDRPILCDSVRTFKVVIDPGHGGLMQSPPETYGDKFDSVSGRYLEPYKNGATYKSRTEMEIVQGVGLEVKEILDLTKTKKGWAKFKSYIKLFSEETPEWIQIDGILSRNDNYKQRNFREKDDKNAPYRLYDYPDFATGKMMPGRISFINSQKPVLVVSLHINDMGMRKDYEKGGGMGVVLSPAYETFDLLKKISEGKKPKEEFLKSSWSNWMIFESKWSRLENAIADSWIYFHGYWPTKDGKKTNLDRFEGYRFNMVQWKYRDKEGWESKVGKSGTYAMNHEKFQALGTFWDRERSNLEAMKREGGAEGYGGDNHYAGMEILRFIQYGLRLQVKEKDTYKEPGKILHPYISTYSLPMLINAISAYLELGDIRSDRDIYYLTNKKRKVAVCIAVGIYSLLHGLKVKTIESTHIPVGEKLELGKYITKSGSNYFQDVIEEK